MKGLHKFLETKIKPHFVEGGKLKRFYVVYDGLETFAFVPPHTTHQGAHLRDGIDLKRTMFMVVTALIPCLLFGMWNVGYQHYVALGQAATFGEQFIYGAIKVLPLVIVAYASGLAVEFLFAGIKGHSIHEGYLVSGMLIPLIVPADLPLWMLAISCIFSVIVAKEVFGGTGMNILNIALTARAFLFFSYPTKMSGNVWVSGNAADFTADGYTGASALGELANTVTTKDPSIVDPIMKMFEPDGMYSISNAFLGLIPGSVGETSALACLIGAAILLFTGIASFRVIASFFIGGLTMAFIFNMIGLNAYMTVDPLHQVMLGGFMFGMVFMATDPVTAAQTPMGKIIYGFFGGFLSIMIRVFNPAYPEGVMMAVLFMNVMAPTIDYFVIQSNIKRRLKRAAILAA